MEYKKIPKLIIRDPAGRMVKAKLNKSKNISLDDFTSDEKRELAQGGFDWEYRIIHRVMEIGFINGKKIKVMKPSKTKKEKDICIYGKCDKSRQDGTKLKNGEYVFPKFCSKHSYRFREVYPETLMWNRILKMFN